MEELGSESLVTKASERDPLSQKFGGMYDSERAWRTGGWLREELRKRTKVMAVVGKVLYVHATIEPAYLNGLGITVPTGPRSSSFPLAEGHHTSIDRSTQYSLTDNNTGKVTDSAWERLGASMILKRGGPGDQDIMTPEDRKKLFDQIDIETWKEMDSPYSL